VIDEERNDLRMEIKWTKREINGINSGKRATPRNIDSAFIPF